MAMVIERTSSNKLIPIEQKLVDFNGAEILGVKANDGKVYVGVKWVCEGIGLTEGQAKGERKKIQEDVVLKQGGRNFILPTNGGYQEVLVIEIDFLPLWLAKISITPNMLEYAPNVADKLIEYQLKAKDVLARAFISQQQPMTTMEMIAYMAQKAAEKEREDARRDQEIEALKNGMDTVTKNMTAVPDSTKVVDMVCEYARWSRLGHNEIYNNIYDVMLKQHGIDIPQRVENERRKVNAEYHLRTGKYYREATLKQKVSGVDIMVRMGCLDKFHSILLGLLTNIKSKARF